MQKISKDEVSSLKRHFSFHWLLFLASKVQVNLDIFSEGEEIV